MIVLADNFCSNYNINPKHIIPQWVQFRKSLLYTQLQTTVDRNIAIW